VTGHIDDWKYGRISRHKVEQYWRELTPEPRLRGLRPPVPFLPGLG
jgi:hypothetical protein